MLWVVGGGRRVVCVWWQACSVGVVTGVWCVGGGRRVVCVWWQACSVCVVARV